jgi:hypothetical protein
LASSSFWSGLAAASTHGRKTKGQTSVWERSKQKCQAHFIAAQVSNN